MGNGIVIENTGGWKRDIETVSGLARRYAEIASLPLMQKTRRRMADNNGLKAGRPPVLLHELPWHELNIGEINYSEVLKAIEATDYNGYVGLEYFPIGDSIKSLKELP